MTAAANARDCARIARLQEDRANAIASIKIMLSAETVDELEVVTALSVHYTAARGLIELGLETGLSVETEWVHKAMAPLFAGAITKRPPRDAMTAIAKDEAQRRSLVAVLLLLGVLPPFEMRDELATALWARNTGEETPFLKAPGATRRGPAHHHSRFLKRYAATVWLAVLRKLLDTDEAARQRLSEIINVAPSTLRDQEREIRRRRSTADIDFDASLRLKLLGLHCDARELLGRVEESIKGDWDRVKKRGARDVSLLARYIVSDSRDFFDRLPDGTLEDVVADDVVGNFRNNQHD